MISNIRRCTKEKVCVKCDRIIKVGEMYATTIADNPFLRNKRLCAECAFDILNKQAIELIEKAEKINEKKWKLFP